VARRPWRPAPHGKAAGRAPLSRTEAMSRPHHNVFFYYHGPSARESRQEGERYPQQVEDNSTKALVNVLQHGGPDVARGFLRRFAPALGDGLQPGVSPELFLQRGPTGPLPSGRRATAWALVARPGRRAAGGQRGREPGRRGNPPGGRRTARRGGQGGDDLDGPQLARHAQRWGVGEPPLLARWADVWRWARDELTRRDGVASFFCRSSRPARDDDQRSHQPRVRTN
jgi:hypothetical protein